jgi:formiminotetrahydrofolate cyclodeaminase
VAFLHGSIERFLKRLASAEPAPGGGSAAALAGSLGAALGVMVCSILLSRQGLPSFQRRQLQKERQRLVRSCRRLSRLVDRDAQAYRRLVQALRAERGVRRARWQALRCPAQICEEAVQAGRILRGLHRHTGPYLGSDLKVGWALLKGAFEAAFTTVEVNLRHAEGSPQMLQMRRRLIRLQGELER